MQVLRLRSPPRWSLQILDQPRLIQTWSLEIKILLIHFTGAIFLFTICPLLFERDIFWCTSLRFCTIHNLAFSLKNAHTI